MAWTVEQARIYLGLDPPTGPPSSGPEDVLIQLVLDETLAAVQGVLGRELELARQTDNFYLVTSDTILLPRFPIVTIHAIDRNGVTPAGSVFGGTDTLIVQNEVGWITSPEFAGALEVSVDYEGGYDTLPLDLEQDMWSAFLTRYGDKDPTTGAPPIAGQGTVTSGSGDVSSVTIADFGTIKYDVGSTVSAGETSEATVAAQYGWLSPWAATWDRYRAGQAGAGLGLV